MTDYEDAVRGTDNGKHDDVQFYLDGMSEEHGEIYGVFKRMRRGDYGEKVMMEVKMRGVAFALRCNRQCLHDFIKETGDHHWYMTRLLQRLELCWDDIEGTNLIKIKIRAAKKQILGKGSNREE